MSIFKKKFELYKIIDGSKEFNVTNSNKFVTHEGVVYEPASISREKIQLKSEMEKQEVSFNFDISHPVAQRYLSTIVESTISIIVFENFDGEYFTLWRGRLVSVSVEEEEVSLRFESAYSKLIQTGAYRRYQRTCPHVLYGDSCMAAKNPFTSNGIIISQNGKELKVVSSDARPNNYFVGGMVGGEDGVLRYITKQSIDPVGMQVQLNETIFYSPVNTETMEKIITSEITLNGKSSSSVKTEAVPYDASLVGTTIDSASEPICPVYNLTIFTEFYFEVLGIGVSMYAGCDKKSTTCVNKFNNIINFGGFPYMPIDNPFESSLT